MVITFQEIILKLKHFWADQGCLLLESYDLEMGAGTYNPATFFGALPNQKYVRVAYVQKCRRPSDSRYGENPNRFGLFYQFQVLIKPGMDDIQKKYIQSLTNLGLDTSQYDLRFMEDNWESPTLGAKGLGWEVWLNGIEISQFTYFQQMAGISCYPVAVEITYGLERIAMIVQNKSDGIHIVYAYKGDKPITYGDLTLENEREFSEYYLIKTVPEKLVTQFEFYQHTVKQLLKDQLVYPAYEMFLKAAGIFNELEASGGVSVAERQDYILALRQLSEMCATKYLKKYGEK